MKIKVNTKQTPEEMLKATGYTLYTAEDVLKTMSKSKQSIVNIEFFKIGKCVTDNELEEEYASRGLVPADPFSMLATSTDELDRMLYVATHWKDTDGKWCYAAFYRWVGDERDVGVYRNDYDWRGYWWFAGLRKSELGTEDTNPSSEPLNFVLCPHCKGELQIVAKKK